MKILLAFDKFKSAISADAACDAAADGVHRALGARDTVLARAPLTDGGEGFCRILTEAANGRLEFHKVSGPLGGTLDAPLGWVERENLPKRVSDYLPEHPGRVALIEMATAAGLDQVPPARRHPRNCTTRGVGELIKIAGDQQAGAILIGIGGSATSDLGFGALEALGLQFGKNPGITPKHWPELAAISGSVDPALPPVYIACDVENPLCGPNGAAQVYGPQKGLSPHEAPQFDAEAERLAEMLCTHLERPFSMMEEAGSGAAGGLGFGLRVACNARYLPGFRLVTAWLDLSSKVRAADLILTGEGKYDMSSLSGKGPYALLELAHAANKPALLFAGATDAEAVTKTRRRFPAAFVHCITPAGYPLKQALEEAPERLKQKIAEVLRGRMQQ
ncbi:MAG: glycerate kinase [Opitutales bacterium]